MELAPASGNDATGRLIIIAVLTAGTDVRFQGPGHDFSFRASGAAVR